MLSGYRYSHSNSLKSFLAFHPFSWEHFLVLQIRVGGPVLLQIFPTIFILDLLRENRTNFQKSGHFSIFHTLSFCHFTSSFLSFITYFFPSSASLLLLVHVDVEKKTSSIQMEIMEEEKKKERTMWTVQVYCWSYQLKENCFWWSSPWRKKKLTDQ